MDLAARSKLFEEVMRRLAPLHPERVVVFGSQARGTAGPDSDLDLMIVTAGGGSLAQRGARLGPPLRGLGIPIDLIVYTPE